MNKNREARKEIVDANRPQNYKKATRRDISAALLHFGIKINDFVYTNKYQDTTTYKYCFINISEESCRKIYTYLRNQGFDVKSVSCEETGSWPRVYKALYVRIIN